MHFLRMFALFLALTFFLPLPAICEQKDDHAMVQLYCLNIGKADCMLLPPAYYFLLWRSHK